MAIVIRAPVVSRQEARARQLVVVKPPAVPWVVGPTTSAYRCGRCDVALVTGADPPFPHAGTVVRCPCGALCELWP